MSSKSGDYLKKPIIFIGNPRSGTTIISNIAMRHKDLGFPSNWHNIFPKSLAINFLRFLFQNPFWEIYSQHKYAFRSSENYTIWSQNLEKELDFGRDFLIGQRASEDTVKRARDYFEKIVRYQRKKRLAFKLTGPAKIEYLLSIFPDAQFVRIHRNPVPTVSSLIKSDFWEDLGATKLWWTGVYSDEEKQFAERNVGNRVAITALQTKKVSNITDMEIEKTGVDVLDVRYTDFIQSPEETIGSILNHLNLSKDPRCFEYFKKNKIYNKNKTDEDYFDSKDLETIYSIYADVSLGTQYETQRN